MDDLTAKKIFTELWTLYAKQEGLELESVTVRKIEKGENKKVTA